VKHKRNFSATHQKESHLDFLPFDPTFAQSAHWKRIRVFFGVFLQFSQTRLVKHFETAQHAYPFRYIGTEPFPEHWSSDLVNDVRESKFEQLKQQIVAAVRR
jgi:hypothetical protein